MYEPVHFHSSSLKSNKHLYYLIIPLLVFSIIMFILILQSPKVEENFATADQSDVLGETKLLDKKTDK